MKVIVEHDAYVENYLKQYAASIEYLSKQHKILDIEEKYLASLSQAVHYAEPSFVIKLCSEPRKIDTSLLGSEEVIFAHIGEKWSDELADSWYSLASGAFKKSEKIKDSKKCYIISCYSPTGSIDAASYIKCIGNLCKCSRTLNKPIIIYAHIEIPCDSYRYRSLTHKIINHYLSDVNGVLITKCHCKDTYKYYEAGSKPYETYRDDTIYLEDCLNDALKKVIPLMRKGGSSRRFKDIYRCSRQTGTLYDDVFYLSINPEEEIYVLLAAGAYREPEYYRALGLDVVPLVDDYSVLYGRKGQFDALSDVLRPQVAPRYDMPILSHIFCYRNIIDAKSLYRVAPENLQYRGRDVYIGVVTVDYVDYTSDALRLAGGETRIACIWDQMRAGEGVYYLKQQIDTALTEANPGAVVPLPIEDSMSTMMLAIAGGESLANNYQGVATEAEFLVAKINPAPSGVQNIYGGVPSIHGVTMADVLIGAIRLIEFAQLQGRPLVLCIPFNGNIDPHDGSFELNQVLSFLALRTNLAIIVPAGEEADKQHHYGTEGFQGALNIVNIRVDKEEQNLVAGIYYRFTEVVNALLYPPAGILAEPINLRSPEITRLNEAVIYSSGPRLNYQNGSRDIRFRIDRPQVGGWRLELTLEAGPLSQVDIWAAQQELNPFITLRPSDPFVTAGSTAVSLPVMSVGAYDRDTMVVLRSSGRGYRWDGLVQPLLITQGHNIIAPCRINEWVSVSGTLPASSIMCGVVATLYSKFIEELFRPLPNTPVMNGIILRSLEQFDGVEYPNPSQGFGIFNINVLRGLLGTPLI